MPTFNYKAVKENGEVFEGFIDAIDEKELSKKIRNLGGVIVNFSKKKNISFLGLFKKMTIFGGGIKTSDKIVFAKNLSAMIGAGLSISKAMTTLEKQFQNNNFRKVVEGVNFSIKEGKTIHESLKEYPEVFPPLFISMVRAGEESGKIADSLMLVHDQMKNSETLRKKIKGALIYPLLITAVMIIIGILMLIFIVPTLQATFGDLGVALPLSTRIIIGFSNFLINNTVIFNSILFVVIFLISLGFKTKRGKEIFDIIVLKIPVISTMIKEINSARTARTLSSLLSSGVDVVTAFDITKDVLQNHYYKSILIEAKNNIQKGVPIADIFLKNEKFYPVIVSAMVEVGEETGKLPEMLLSIADFYEEEIDQKTKNISTIIEPVLMVVIGFAVGFFAISMITPMYSLMNTI